MLARHAHAFVHREVPRAPALRKSRPLAKGRAIQIHSCFDSEGYQREMVGCSTHAAGARRMHSIPATVNSEH